jgi:hypothetical protein
MKPEFEKYFISLGLEGSILGRIETILNFYTTLLGCDVKNIFISEYLNEDGSRVYENLWIFNDEVCGEAKQFILSDDFDFDRIKNTISNFNIKNNDYDIVSNVTTEKSRMYLLFLFQFANRGGEMKASKENCKKLREIFLTYILPNLTK